MSRAVDVKHGCHETSQGVASVLTHHGRALAEGRAGQSEVKVKGKEFGQMSRVVSD